MNALIALHGFFGSPKDFKCLGLSNVRAPNIFNTQLCALSSWAARFNKEVPKNSIILGYSMGARLALHCLLNKPTHYQAAIIMAAHPGLKKLSDREKRYADDLKWAKEIDQKPWPLLMEAWNKRPILASGQGPERLSRTFDKKSLALSMKRFSLGTQDYLMPMINELSLPILWLYARDEEAPLADLRLKNPFSLKKAMPNGHRFLFSHPHQVSQAICSFLRNIH